MRQSVSRLTTCLLQEGRSDATTTAQVFANFSSQLAVQPFIAQPRDTSRQRFGDNVLDTLAHAKKASSKAGCPADKLRRQIVVAGSEGPLATHKVCERQLFAHSLFF